jgi:hypothetical protein
MSMTGDYPNRSDLRNPATRRVEFTGQTYGQGAAQQQAQDVVPAGSAEQDVRAQQIAAQGSPRPRPGAQPFGRASERPDEPITAGADFGPGPNAVGAGIRPKMIAKDSIELQLEALYRYYPTEGVRVLLDRMRQTRFRSGRIA